MKDAVPNPPAHLWERWSNDRGLALERMQHARDFLSQIATQSGINLLEYETWP